MVGRGRQQQEEVAAAARRRLELLGRELEAAGLRRVDEDDPVAGDPAAPEDLVAPSSPSSPHSTGAVVRPAGRHARARPPGPAARLCDGVADRWADRWGERWAEVAPSAAPGRVGLQRGHAVLVVVLLLAGLGTAAYVWGRAQPRPVAVTQPPAAAEPLVELTPATSPGVTASPATGSPPSPGASSSTTAQVVVDVAGKVRRPGVATLPAGSRVVDAIEHAGGARAGVDLRGLNLARLLVDGEQVLVGAAAAPGPGGLAAGAAQAAPDPVAALVSLNTATAEQLDTLPGVGPVTAQKILDWRSTHGTFTAVDELLEVDGIGDKTLADIAPHVTL